MAKKQVRCQKGIRVTFHAGSAQSAASASKKMAINDDLRSAHLRICTNRLLATATTLAVCAATMATTIPTLSPLPMTQHPQPFVPSPRPCAAVLRPQARVC
jgi:hypothetical protein